jgi:hypothetical protein
MGLMLAAGLAFAQGGRWDDLARPKGIQLPGSPCGSFATLSSTFQAAPGFTNGIFGVPLPGEVFRVNVVGPGTGTFRIVGDPAGALTLAGPATVPGTLVFTAPYTPPPTLAGVGFFFDAGAGTVTLGASCSPPQVPALNRWGLLALILALALGGWWLRHARAAGR